MFLYNCTNIKLFNILGIYIVKHNSEEIDIIFFYYINIIINNNIHENIEQYHYNYSKLQLLLETWQMRLTHPIS